jgi:N-acetylglutamate synthase-like GNAT family acetyltransferase
MALDDVDDRSTVRRAEAREAGFLTELALRSKAHWGYDPEFIRACRADLTVDPDLVAADQVYMVEDEGRVVGYYSLERRTDDEVELVHLFVEPAVIGKGFGKLLWRHAVDTARRMGFQEVVLSSDPYAEDFYKAMGARRVGEIASPVSEDRKLPLLRFDCNASTV